MSHVKAVSSVRVVGISKRLLLKLHKREMGQLCIM